MLTGLNHLHSSLRYVIVILFILSILSAFIKWRGKKGFTKGDKMLYMFTMVFCHIQLVIGLILYFGYEHYRSFSTEGAMKISALRFFAMEHFAGMLLGIILVTVGHSLAKRTVDEVKKHQKIFIFYTISFLVIFFSIPWPFLKDFGTWF